MNRLPHLIPGPNLISGPQLILEANLIPGPKPRSGAPPYPRDQLIAGLPKS